MQMSGSGTRAQVDLSSVVTRVQTIAEARSLPAGTVVGDMHGGVTFSDAVAKELERRSQCGWLDVTCPAPNPALAAGGSAGSGTNDRRWTVIIINR
jgi:hypothetical protein